MWGWWVLAGWVVGDGGWWVVAGYLTALLELGQLVLTPLRCLLCKLKALGQNSSINVHLGCGGWGG